MLKVYRKFSLVLSLLLFVSVFSSPFAFASNNDIQNHWAAEDINEMIEKGYLSGYPDGSFNPDQEMTRAQFVKVINKVFGFSEEGDTPFGDLESSDWFYRDIRIAYKMGYIKGISLDEFGPNEVIKRQDVAVILARVLGLEEDASYCNNFSDNSQISDYAKGAVGAIAKSGIMIGYNDKSFNPNKNITRAEVIVAERASNYAKENLIETPEKPETTKPADSTGKTGNESSNHNNRNPKKDVVLSEAEFNGLTRIIVKTNILLEGIKADDIVITKIGGAVVSSDKITKIQSDSDKLTIDLSMDVFATESSKGTIIRTKDFDLYKASNSVSVGINGDTLNQVLDRITSSDPGNNSLWHNLGEQTAIKANPNPIAETSNGKVYNQIGDIKGLMVVIDFNDAKAMDNTGVNGMPGKIAKDEKNRVHGHVLQTADDYYDWIIPRAEEFYDTASYGQLDLNIDLVKNPDNPSGVFTCSNSLYGGQPTDKVGHTGYALDRGGDTDSYVKDGLTVAKSQLKALQGEYDIIYVVAVENAVGISYGPMNTEGYDANTWSGRTDLKAMVRIGYDTYSGWKSKGVNHETGHAIGAPDYYINAFSGPGSGQCDPVTGKADYYPYSGHWDLMGYINGPAPDMFSWMKWRLGWIRDDQVDIIDSDGTTTHQLSPVEVPGGTKTILVTGEDKGVYYVIENRQIAGVDNTAVTEKSTDSDDNYQNNDWIHNYGPFNSPGILMYKIDANVNALSGGLTVVELKPEQTTSELAASLDKSVLGASSGIYEYTDVASGITVKLVNESDSINTVTVTKKAPAEKVKPVLSDARFIDSKTIEFKTNDDLRGATADKFIVKNGNEEISGVKINQILPRRVRLTFSDGQFTEGDTASIMTEAFMFYGDSEEVVSSALTANSNPVLSEAKFNSLTEIEAKCDLNLKDITKTQVTISKKDGTVVPSSDISSVVFDAEINKLTITLKNTTFTKNIQTEGVSLNTNIYSNYYPAIPDKEMAQFNPPVTVIGASNKITTTSLDKGALKEMTVLSEPYKTYYAIGDTLNIDGLEVVGTYSVDDSTEVLDIQKEDITGFDSSKVASNQELTINCQGKTTSCNVNITDKPNSIYIDNSSNQKISYYVGEKLNIEGLIVKGVIATSGSAITTESAINVSIVDVSGFDSSKVVDKETLTVTYGGAIVTYDITIKAKPAEDMNTQVYYKLLGKGANGVADTDKGTGNVLKWWDWTIVYPNDCDSTKWKFVYAEDYYYKIIIKSSGKFLKVSGDDLKLEEDSNDDSVLWRVIKVGNYYKIVNKANGNAVTASGDGNGDLIGQGAYTGSDYQLWTPVIMDEN